MPSQRDDNTLVDPVLSHLRDLYGRVCYTYKAQEKAADATVARLSWIKATQITFAAVTTTSLLSTLFGKTEWTTWLAAVVSAFQTVLALYSKEYSLGEVAEKHISTASAMWKVREQLIVLIADRMAGLASDEDSKARRDALVENLAGIYQAAPRTTGGTYEAAKRALTVNEEQTLSNAEIDHLLPVALRLTQVRAGEPIVGDQSMPSKPKA